MSATVGPVLSSTGQVWGLQSSSTVLPQSSCTPGLMVASSSAQSVPGAASNAVTEAKPSLSQSSTLPPARITKWSPASVGLQSLLPNIHPTTGTFFDPRGFINLNLDFANDPGVGNVQQDPPPFPPYLFRDVLLNDMVIAVTTAVLGTPVKNTMYGGNTAMPR